MSKPAKNIKLDVLLLLEGLFFRWRLILIPMLVFPVIVSLALFLGIVPKRYKARAQLFVQDSMDVNPFLEDMQVEWTVQNRLPLIQSVLRSRATLEKVLTDLGEIQEHTLPAERDGLIGFLRSQINVYGMGGGLVYVEVVGNSPQRSYDTIKALVDVLIDTMLRPQKQSLEEASKFLEKQLSEMRVSLGDVEEKIQVFKQNNAEELPEVFQVNMNSYLGTQQSLMAAQAELRAARHRKANLEARLKVYNPIARAIESKLVRAKAELAEMKSVYNDDHPQVVALRARVDELTKERKAANIKSSRLNLKELESTVALQTGLSSAIGGGDGMGVTNQTSDILTSDLLDYKAVAAEIASLRGSVSALKGQGKDTLDSVKSFAVTERTLAELTRDYEVKQNIYRNLLEKYEDAKITKALSLYDENSQVWLIEEPRLPTTPIGFNNPFMILLAVAGGLALGLFAVIVLELLSGTVRRPADAELLTGATILGVMPKLFHPVSISEAALKKSMDQAPTVS
ncbi:MAG: hypothetical protein GY854_19050 [Deltaproteobacteria bacterium]|nr:hypothetical protein [Deltaproteobacteria bacterium]